MEETKTPLQARLEREEREKLAFFALSERAQKAEQVRNFLRYKEDPWAFLSDCIWTKDPLDREMAIKPYPTHFPYTRLLALLFTAKNPDGSFKHPMTAVPKSRRMHASWTYLALSTHFALFTEHQHIGFVSKKEEDSYELVMRAEHMIKHIPEWRIPAVLLPKIKNGGASKKPPILQLENGTKIQGFPQGEDQLRQHSLSLIIEDECAFWEDAEGSYAGAKPTTDGGGRMTLISSRSPSFFKKVVFDQLDSPDLNFPELVTGEVKHPMTGVELWKNPKNGFLVIDLHYTANPEKQGAEWKEAIANGMPRRKFLMEYEKNWETFEGKPVFEDFIKGTHSVASVLKPKAGLPLLLGVDFGLTPSIVICQLDGPQLRILKEHNAFGSIDKLAKHVWSDLNLNYRNWVLQDDMIITCIDPAGNQRSQTDEKTCAQELYKAGFKKILPGPVDWESRRSAVEHFLTSYSKEGPCLLISETGCPTLVQGFSGGYTYAENVYNIEPAKARPLKNSFSHVADATQYVAAIARGLQKKHAKFSNMQAPSYGFQKGHQE